MNAPYVVAYANEISGKTSTYHVIDEDVDIVPFEYIFP